MYVGDVHALLSKIVAAEAEVVGGVTVSVSQSSWIISKLSLSFLSWLKKERGRLVGRSVDKVYHTSFDLHTFRPYFMNNIQNWV